MVCSNQWEGSSFYSGEAVPKGGARVVDGVVVPGRRRGKAWARRVAVALARLTRAIVALARLCSDGEVDGSAQAMADGRGRARHLRRSRGPVGVSRRSSDSSRVDWR